MNFKQVLFYLNQIPLPLDDMEIIFVVFFIRERNSFEIFLLQSHSSSVCLVKKWVPSCLLNFLLCVVHGVWNSTFILWFFGAFLTRLGEVGFLLQHQSLQFYS